MPWKETCAMDQRFIGDWLNGQYTKIDLCGFYGISRPTGDKWIQRYERLGGWFARENDVSEIGDREVVTVEFFGWVIET